MANRKQTEHEEDQFIHAIMDATLDGHPLKDLRGVSNDQMESIYSFAYEFYEQGKLDEAERLFHFLCIYDLYDTRYWLGLAAIYQLKENYQKAIDIYAVAFTQGKKDYRPMFYTGQCHLALGKAGKAKLCFEYVLARVQEPEMLQRAQSYLEALSDIESDHSEEKF